jgi:hypothetical protein
MKIETWLYFRNVTAESGDDGDTGATGVNPSSICIPASAIKQITPSSSTTVKIQIDSCKLWDASDEGLRSRHDGADKINLNVTAGKAQEVIQALAEAISSNEQFVVVADDMTTNAAGDTVAARYLHPDITGMNNIIVYQTKQGYGMHEYYEEVTPMAADDDDVAASLSISLPAQVVLIEAALIPTKLALSNHGLVALEYHNAAIDDDDPSEGTEWVGADTVGNTSIPSSANCDLDMTAGVLGKGIWSGSAGAVNRDGSETFFHVTAKENLSLMSGVGTARVGVYVKWWGGPAVLA